MSKPHRSSPTFSVSFSPSHGELGDPKKSCCLTIPSTQVVSAVAMVRNRLFLLFLLSLVFCSSLFVFSATNGPQRARIHSLVTETQQQITDHLKKNFKDGETLLRVDARYLAALGLEIDEEDKALEVERRADTGEVEDDGEENDEKSEDYFSPPPPLWPDSPWRAARNASAPVVLSAVQAGHAGEAVHFLRNTQLFLPSHNVILYDLGLGSHELTLVQHYCNTSLCSLKKFDPALFPGHVRNYRTNAFRLKNFSFLPSTIANSVKLN